MSALNQIGDADQKLQQAEIEIGSCIGADELLLSPYLVHTRLTRAVALLTQARSRLAAVRLDLRNDALEELAQHHEEMGVTLREAAVKGNFPQGRGLHLIADDHERHAKAIRALIGAAGEATAGGAVS